MQIPTAENFKVLPHGVDAKFDTHAQPVDVLTSGVKNLQRGLGIWANNREDTLVSQAANDYMNYCAENQQKYRSLSNDAALKDEDGNDVLQGMNRDRVDYRSKLTRGFGARALDAFNRHVSGAERSWTASTTSHRYEQEQSSDKIRMEVAKDNYWKQGVDAWYRDDDEAFRQALSDTASASRAFLEKYSGFKPGSAEINKLVGFDTANFLLSCVSVLKEKDPDKARKVMEQYGHLIPGSQYGKVMQEVVAADELAAGAAAFAKIKETGSVEVGGTGIGTQAWGQAFQNAVKNDKRPYSQGANRSDCSSFIGEAVGGMNLPKGVKKMFQGTSDSIIQNLGKKYGYGVQGGKLPDKIGAGVVISLDTGNYDYDKSHWNGIDHIAVTVQGNDGKIYVAEKTKSGAKMTEYNRWKNFGTYRRSKVWTVDVSSVVGQSSGGKRMSVNFADMNVTEGQMMEVIKKSYPHRSDNFYRGAMEGARWQAEANRERKHQRDEATANWMSQQHLAVEKANLKLAQGEHALKLAAIRNGQMENQLTPQQYQNYATSNEFKGEENWVWSAWKLASPNEFDKTSLADVASLTAGDGNLNKVMTNTWNWYRNRKNYNPSIPVMSPNDISYVYQSLGLNPNNLSIEDKNKIGRTLHYAYTHYNEKAGNKMKYPSFRDAIAAGAEQQMSWLERMGVSY